MDTSRSGDHPQVQAAAGRAVGGGPSLSATASASASATASSLPPPAPSASDAAVQPRTRDSGSIDANLPTLTSYDAAAASADDDDDGDSPPVSRSSSRNRWTGADFGGVDAAIEELMNTPPNVQDPPMPPSQIAAAFDDDMDNAIKESIKESMKDAKSSGSGMDPPLPPSHTASLVGDTPPSLLAAPPIEKEETLQKAQDPHTPAVTRAPSPPPMDQGRGPSNPRSGQEIPVRTLPGGSHAIFATSCRDARDARLRSGSTFGGTATSSLAASTLDAHVSLFAHSRHDFADGEGTEAYRRQNTRGEYLINAELVEPSEPSEPRELVTAEPMVNFDQRYKRIGLATFFSFLVIVVALALSLHFLNERNKDMTQANIPVTQVSTPVPSMRPSPSPTFDPRPTLDIVRERGHVRCGLREGAINPRTGFETQAKFYLDLCRSVAAVLFGNPQRFVPVEVTLGNRFRRLHDRDADLLLSPDKHTIEREVRERTTGSGFTFSSPYFYDGLAYFGDKHFVQCAEEERGYGECASLRICVQDQSIFLDFLQHSFPLGFLTTTSSLKDSFERLSNGACNVLTAYPTLLQTVTSRDKSKQSGHVLGNKTLTKDPLAIVTRKTDREFSDVVNWVVQALFYGEEQGLTKNVSLCQNYTNLTLAHPSELNFLNAVYCVGNYGEINPVNKNRGMNQINNGTTGMLFATPFGELENPPSGDLGVFDATDDKFLKDIKKSQQLNCGVVVPGGSDGNIDESRELFGMSVDYCHGLAAALFNGNHKAVNFTTFSENDASSFAALDKGSIDVLAGGRIERKYDFGSPPSLRGVHFSTPYYYGNETASDNVSFFALATRDDSPIFSSFVNCVVLATIYAKENGITKKRSKEMPFLSLFGNELRWMLRDSISYLGSYDQIHAKNFNGVFKGILEGNFDEEASCICDVDDIDVEKDDLGRNYLNKGGPQIHSFPGLPNTRSK